VPISNLRFPIEIALLESQSEFGNWKYPETPIGGQGAQCPDRLIAKKAANLRQIFSE
jgi:hypothetical protein